MRKKQKIINLYQDSSIHSIKHVISVGSEEDLNQFWHYFDQEIKNDYSLLYSFIGLMYAFISRLFEEDKALFFELIIEQNDDLFYFTVWNSAVSTAWMKLLEERQNDFEYKRDKKRVTVKLLKEKLVRHDEVYEDEKKNERENLITSLTREVPVLQPPYGFLQVEDREELLKICDDMSDLMYQSKKVGFHQDVFIRLRSYLSIFSLTMMPYPQVSSIARLTTDFSVLMNSYQDAFKTMQFGEMALLEGFVNNIDRWANTLFVSGGADLHFMDNSLKADLERIRMLVEPQPVAQEAQKGDFLIPLHHKLKKNVPTGKETV